MLRNNKKIELSHLKKRLDEGNNRTVYSETSYKDLTSHAKRELFQELFFAFGSPHDLQKGYNF